MQKYAAILLFTYVYLQSVYHFIFPALWPYLPADYPVRRPSYSSTVGIVLQYHGHNMVDNMAANLKAKVYGYEAELVQKKKTNNVPTINNHLKNILKEGDLQKEVVVSKMEITTRHSAI